MLFATIHNTATTNYFQNGVSIGAGETLFIRGHNIPNLKLDSDGYIYQIDLGHTVHNPWSTVGYSNVPRHVPGASNGSGGEGLLLTVWLPQEHLLYGSNARYVTN